MSVVSSTKLCLCYASAALVVAALGCGGSTDDGSGGAGGSGGSTSSGASGGTGGSTTGGTGGSTTGGTGGSGGSGGSGGGVPDAGDVVCGGMVCPPTMFGGMPIPACCTPQNTCGISIGGGGTCFDPGTFDAAPPPEAGTGVPDPNCASIMIAGFPLSGCCRPDNTCGFMAQFAGCVSYDQLRMFPGANLPEGGPMSCVYPPP